MISPRQFFDEFVVPTVEEWRQDPLNVRKAVIAISQIDILLDQFVAHTTGLTGDELRDCQSDERRKLADPTICLVRDIHDTHKHGPLGRKNAKIKTGKRPRKGFLLNRLFIHFAFRQPIPILMIEQDDGTTLFVPDIIEKAIAYWQSDGKLAP
jgi:hypothetical protein